VRRDAQAVLLLLMGGTLLKIGLAGTYLRYVKASSLPLLLAGGAVLVAVAAATLWQVFRAPTHAPTHAQTHATTHATSGGNDEREADVGHVHGEPGVGWLLLAPTLALLLFAPPAVGAFQASRNGTALSAQASSDFAPLPHGDPIRLSMLDYASRAVFDHGVSLRNRRITLSGFVIAGPAGQPYLTRMVVTCCAADARPVKVGLSGDVPPALAADEWLEVEGTYTVRADHDPVNGEVIPYLQVTSSRDIAAPTEQYES
jgi:uncharacterized repeat protein (TIGR03943 family)